MKRYEFIEKTLCIIRKELSKKLPYETTEDKMIEKTKIIIKNIYEKEVKL
jgi:hypothetical protein